MCMQEQIQERAAQQEEARAEHERERAMVDAVMAAIDEEDRLQGELKVRKANETVAYINAFVADREARREAQRRSEYEEERKIQVRRARLVMPQPLSWLHATRASVQICLRY